MIRTYPFQLQLGRNNYMAGKRSVNIFSMDHKVEKMTDMAAAFEMILLGLESIQIEANKMCHCTAKYHPQNPVRSPVLRVLP